MKIQINHIMEFTALLVTIFYYPYLKKTCMKWFLPFLAFILVTELILAYEYYYNKDWPDVAIYYILSVIEIIFYSYIFYKICQRRTLQKMIRIFLYISIMAYIIGFIFDSSDYLVYLPILIISGFLLSAIALGYIYTVYVDDDNTLLITEPGFWIAIGVSVFFAGTSIVFSLYDFILRNNLRMFGVRLYNFVPRVLCIVLYFSISIAIMLCKKKTNVSL